MADQNYDHTLLLFKEVFDSRNQFSLNKQDPLKDILKALLFRNNWFMDVHGHLYLSFSYLIDSFLSLDSL